jgi:hypothetical protein
MGAVNCRQGQHTRVAAPCKVDCGIMAALRGREGRHGLEAQEIPD